MENKQQLINTIEAEASSGIRRKVTGRNALVKNLFEFLFKRTNLNLEMLILCTRKGLILNCYSPHLNEDLAGYAISMDIFKAYQPNLLFNDSLEGFTLISATTKENIAPVNQLQTNLKMLLATFDAHKDREQYLLDSLDAIENAICIYDKDAALLYGNKAYCDNMQIFDRESALGMNILDITKQAGIKIHAKKSGSNNLKMMDVLKSGKKTLDWEVMIESKTSPNKAQFVSNNMYPIKNTSGSIDGMVEIAYSHQLNLSKTKKLMGLTAECTFDSIIGSSEIMTAKISQAKEYARSPYNLLIVGESGVGKELFAQSIHNYSDRCNEPFVALNCASFPENLIESELFGYVGGAFTGASKNGQLGKFELADKGTLFLDEIGELPYHFQAKLLRVLETHKITRIGSSTQTPVNVRVIAATNRNLEKMIDEGLFRKDLYYRLQVLSIEIPPLRERRDDLLLLTESFLGQAADTNDEELKHLDVNAQKSLMSYDWPGNVRELRNVIHRITLLSKSKAVTKEDLDTAIHSKGYALKSNISETPESRLDKCMSDINNSYALLIKEALDIAGGNNTRAAELLGVSRKTFYRMRGKYC